jgi:hypothetical protein
MRALVALGGSSSSSPPAVAPSRPRTRRLPRPSPPRRRTRAARRARTLVERRRDLHGEAAPTAARRCASGPRPGRRPRGRPRPHGCGGGRRGQLPTGDEAALIEGRTGKMLVASWFGAACDKKVDVTVVGTQVLIAPAPRRVRLGRVAPRRDAEVQVAGQGGRHEGDPDPAADPVGRRAREPPVRSRRTLGDRRSPPG